MTTAAVVVPVYATEDNGRLDFLKQTLDSVEKQTHAGTVGVVVDDGSPVNVEVFMRERGYVKSRYVRRERHPDDLRTASNALNLGLDLSLERSGDVFTSEEAQTLAAVGYLHSDDMLPYGSVAARLASLAKTNSFAFGDVALIDGKNRYVGQTIWGSENLQLMPVRPFPHHTTLWTLPFLTDLKNYTAEAFEQSGVFDPRLSHGEDRDVSLSSIELAEMLGETPQHISGIMYIYRRHAKTITGTKVEREDSERQKKIIREKHYLDQDELTMQSLKLRLVRDMPWSWFFWLPDDVKQPFRPVREGVKRAFAQNISIEELLTQPSHLLRS